MLNLDGVIYYFPFFRPLLGASLRRFRCQMKGSESGMSKSDSRKYSCLQGRFSTVTVCLDLLESNEALPSQRNPLTEDPQGLIEVLL
jgi:hypothetical protein